MKRKKIYFSHDYNAQADAKIEHLICEMGWEGYGLFWAIIEKLAQEKGTWKLQKNYKKLSFVLHTSEEKIKQIIEDFDLFVFDEGFFWSNRLNENFKKRKLLSSKRRNAAQIRWVNGKQGYAKAMQMHTKSNANAYQKQCNCIPKAMQMHRK